MSWIASWHPSSPVSLSSDLAGRHRHDKSITCAGMGPLVARLSVLSAAFLPGSLARTHQTLQGSPTSGCGERGPARAGCCGRIRDFRGPRQARGNKLQGPGTNRMEQNQRHQGPKGRKGSGGILHSITAAIQSAILLYIAHFQAHSQAARPNLRQADQDALRYHGCTASTPRCMHSVAAARRPP